MKTHTNILTVEVHQVSLIFFFPFFLRSRFCNGSEICLDHSIVPPLDDDVQLSVAEYRDKLYELISNGKHASKRTSSPKIIKGGSPSLRKKMVESNKAEPDQPAAAASGKRHEEAEGIKENVLYQHKYLTSKVKFYKNHSVEELSKGTVNPVAASKSEPGQKNGIVLLSVVLSNDRTGRFTLNLVFFLF